MEKVQGSDAETEKNDVDSSKIEINGNGNCESDDQKARAACWRVTGPARRSSKGNWTEEEDKILRGAVQRFNGKCWKKIAECLRDRTDVQCLHRWQKVLNPELVKGPWTKEEDDLIIELVGKRGTKKWSEIAKHLTGRIGKQCRERWHNHLNPEINKSAWTREEELILIEAHSTHGNRWAEISKFLHGRPENSIKNHWNCSLKKKLEQNSSRSASDHPEFAIPTLCSTKTEAGNGVEMMIKQSPRAGFTVNQDTNCEAISDACSLDLILGQSEKRDNILKAPERENFNFPSRQANSPIEPPSLACTEIIQNQEKGDNAERSGDHYHIIPMLSNVSANGFVTENANAHLPHYKYGYFINSPSQRPPCLYLPQHCNSPLGVTDVCNNTHLTGGYPFPLNSDWRKGSPLSKDCRDFSYSRQSNCSCSIISRDGVGEQRTIKGMCKKSVGKGYTGLCYEPLQGKDLKFFLSTGRFPSPDSYIQLTSTSTTLQNPRVLLKRSNAYSCPESILRRAALSFDTPSIIRKRRVRTSNQASTMKHTDNILTSDEDFDSCSKRLQVAHEFPSAVPPGLKAPQERRKLESSSATISAGKCLKDAFDNVWDLRKS